MELKLDGATIYYEVHGPAGAPAIVFCHGVAMDHRTFATQVAALHERYRVIVWDMPYHGRSSAIDRAQRFSPTAAACLVGILDALAIPQAVLAGLSLGTFVTQQAACAYPDRVEALIHISGGALYPRYPGLLRASIPFVTAALALWPTRPLARAFAKHKTLTADTLAYLEETVIHTGKGVVTHLCNEMVRDMVIGLPAPPPHPALILYGDHDLRPLRAMSQRWHARHPRSRLVEVPNAHHIANQDNPEALNAALLEYLRDLRQQPAVA